MIHYERIICQIALMDQRRRCWLFVGREIREDVIGWWRGCSRWHLLHVCEVTTIASDGWPGLTPYLLTADCYLHLASPSLPSYNVILYHHSHLLLMLRRYQKQKQVPKQSRQHKRNHLKYLNETNNWHIWDIGKFEQALIQLLNEGLMSVVVMHAGYCCYCCYWRWWYSLLLLLLFFFDDDRDLHCFRQQVCHLPVSSHHLDLYLKRLLLNLSLYMPACDAVSIRSKESRR